ncbi:MAG: indole-3-glycerol-phosphate synthase [Candidatus Hydrothermarchaeales archaeon]
MNFDQILKDCKMRFKGFDKKVEVKRKPKSLEDAIIKKKDGGLKPVITEIKPASPSGVIKKVDDPKKIAEEMINGGACALSVLTEEKFFNGSLKNLKEVSSISPIPVLRKDFIFDKNQVDQSYYYGADSLLLIASFFKEDKLKVLIDKTRDFGMEPLVEIHSLEDYKTAKRAGARIYAINNRDKDTMQIDLKRSKIFPKHMEGTTVSASGISTLDDLNFVLGYCDAALVGTSVMTTDDIEGKVRGFVYGK